MTIKHEVTALAAVVRIDMFSKITSRLRARASRLALACVMTLLTIGAGAAVMAPSAGATTPVPLSACFTTNWNSPYGTTRIAYANMPVTLQWYFSGNAAYKAGWYNEGTWNTDGRGCITINDDPGYYYQWVVNYRSSYRSGGNLQYSLAGGNYRYVNGPTNWGTLFVVSVLVW